MKTNDEIDRLMKRCQIGFGGSNAVRDAHDCLADCYGALGTLQSERNDIVQVLKAIKEWDISQLMATGHFALPDELRAQIQQVCGDDDGK